MRRVFLLAFLLVLAIGAITPVEVAAADGAESSDSITSFSETTSDDAMLYPDCEQAEGNDYTLHSLDFLDGTISIHTMDCTTDDFVSWNYAAGSTSNDADTLNMSVSVAGTACEWFDGYDSNYHNFLAFYLTDASGGPWTLEYYDAGWQDYSQVNFTTADIGSVVEFTMSSWPNHESATYQFIFESIGWLQLDWIICSDTPHYELDTWTGFTESFADVSEINATLGETVTTDGDLGTFHHPGDNAWDYYFWNAPSALAVQVIEWRCHANISSSSYEFALYSADDGGGSQLWTSGSITAPTSAGTKKYSPMVTGAESIRLATRHASSPASFIFDYLRGSLSTEMGWQHDGSTTAGVEEFTNSEYDYYISTDGDILNMTSKRGTGADTKPDAYYKMYYDTTATNLDLESTYYQFLEFRYRVADPSGAIWIYAYMDGKVKTQQMNEDGAWHTERINIAAAGAGSQLKYIRWSLDYTYVDDRVTTLLLDYSKYYSIANDTVTQSGAGTDDYLYTDSGVLYSNIDDGYIELNHDPALSVSDTYSVWNLTTPSTAPEFSQYVSEWSAYSDETRGATTSGTVTDIKLKFDSIETISAIKFIEDGTAPAVVRSSSTPNDPQDDESTTLSAVITDTVEVYTVKFNAIVYPTGFSDVDYSANEQADNLWNYTFSSLDAGYYCFKIIASDGANTNALTEYAYIELTVREAAIRVEEITLIGAGSDFSMMTFSARINRDCSFTIYEESASSPESDTHTGSVTAPSFNLAWTKLDVDDSNVNFTIRFTSGSLTYNYTSQYQVAQTTFYVSTVTQMVSLDTVTVTGRISKLGTYLVYDGSDVLQSYGTLADLDFKIQFTRWGGYDEQNHDFAIKFTNGTQTCWYNSSFYAFKKPVVAAFQTTDPNALYAFQASFWTLIAVVAVGGMVAVDFYRKEVK